MFCKKGLSKVFIKIFILLLLAVFIAGFFSSFAGSASNVTHLTVTPVSHSNVLKENTAPPHGEKGAMKRINNIAIDLKDYEVPRDVKLKSAQKTEAGSASAELSEKKSVVDSALRNFIDSNQAVFEVSSSQLSSEKSFYDKSSKDSEEERTWYVSYKQSYNSIPVEDTLVSVLIIDGKIVQLKSQTFDGISIDTTPGISEQDAVSLAKQQLNLPNSFVPDSMSLAIYPDNSKKPVSYYLTWKIEFPLIEGENSAPFAWIVFVDAHTGDLIHKYNRVVFGEVSGQVTGMVKLANSSSTATLVNFSNNNITAIQETSLVGSNITNSSGGYNISGISGTVTIRANLSGPYVKVINADQAIAKHAVNVTVPGTASWNWSEIDNSSSDEESTMFYHVNAVHDFFTRGDPFNITEMNYQIPATVEYGTNYCNAFYTSPTAGMSFGNSVSCGNLALSSDVIYHEYAHAVTDKVYVSLPYSAMTGAINEGLSDYFAATINNDPRVAEVNWNPYLRAVNNTDVYPTNWAGEVHADSTMFSGALWDVRQSLGSNVTDQYIIKSMKAQASSFSEFLDDFLIFNDNNTNLSDGTPNRTQICAAFTNNHGIQSQYCNSSISGFSITEGASYSWVNAAGVGTKVNVSVSTAGTAGMGDDDITSAINLGFSFPFYHHNYTSVRIGSNGLLTFSSFTPNLFEFCSLPATVAPNNMISVFCADLDPSASGDVYYWNDNANNVFVAEWFNVPLYGTNNFSTVEAVLYDDGKIKLQYVNITNSTFGYAAVGTENIAGTVATVYYNHSSVDRLDPFALLFVPANAAPNITSSQPASGSITVAENSSLRLNISVNDLDFDNMTFAWYLNGTLKNTTQNITLSFNITSSGNYLVRFVAADFYKANGTQEWNLTVTDISAPPSAGNVAITPSTAYINSTLNCTYAYSGGNAESGTVISWFTNSKFNSSFENSTIVNSTFITKYANWTCQVIPHDSQTNGSTVNSSTVTIQNAPPNTIAPTLSPSSANKTVPFILCANSTFQDLENDTAQWLYKWRVNVNITNVTSNNITNASFSHFDNITCELIPYDGTANGTAVNSSVLAVQNLVPSAPTNITPVSGIYGPKNQLVSISCLNSSDLDADTVSYNIQAYYSSAWNSLALLDSDGNYSWNISSLATQSNILLRCNSSDSFSTSLFINRSSNITIDNTIPSLASSYPSNSSFYNSSNLSINFMVNDAVYSTLDKCWILNTTNRTIELPGCANSSFIAGSDGLKNITLFVNDSANNINSSNVFFTVDTVFPSLSVVSPVNASFYNSSNISLRFSVNDTNLASCWFTNTTGSNLSLANCVNITISDVVNALRSVTVFVNDSAGNINSSAVFFTIDSVFPALIVASPVNNSYVNSTNISVKYSAADSNLNSCWFINTTGSRINLTNCINATLLEGNGNRNITLYINDTAGNLNVSHLFFTADSIFPTVPIIQGQTPANNSFINTSAYVVNVSFFEANQAFCWLFNTTAARVNMTLTSINATAAYCNATIQAGDGLHNYSVYLNDSAGNLNQSSTYFLTIDTIVPSINISSLSNNSYHNKTAVDVNFSASDTNLDKCWLINITGGTQNLSNCTSISIIFANLTGTYYNLTVFANDSAHNSNSSQLFFTVQLAPPIISNVSSSSVTSSGATISVTTSDLANVTISYGITAALGSTAISSSFAASSSIALSSLSASTLYYYNVTSCNNAGFCNTSGIYNFTTSAASVSNSPGGGGGGGGGGSSSSSALSTSRLNYIWPTLSAGVSKVSISQSEIAFSSVSLDVSTPTPLKNAALEIRGSIPSSEISEKAKLLDKEVYQYLSVTSSVVTNSFIEAVEIVFKVNKSWLSSKGISQSNIALYRYMSDEKMWVERPTILLEESQVNASDTALFSYYSATTPGFSYFAIAPKTQAAAKQVAGPNATAASTTAEENITAIPVNEPALPQNKSAEATIQHIGKENSKQSSIQFILSNKEPILFIAVVLAAILAIVLLKKFISAGKYRKLGKEESSIKKFIEAHETKKLQELKQALEKEKLLPSFAKMNKKRRKK